MNSLELNALLEKARTYTGHAEFDSADLRASIATLEAARDMSLNNAPIYLESGDLVQWKLCLENIRDFALGLLALRSDSGAAFDSVDPLQRIKLSSEAISIVDQLKAGVDALQRIKQAKRLVEVVLQIGGGENKKSFFDASKIDLNNPYSVVTAIKAYAAGRYFSADDAFVAREIIEKTVGGGSTKVNIDYEEFAGASFKGNGTSDAFSNAIEVGASISADIEVSDDCVSAKADEQVKALQKKLFGFDDSYVAVYFKADGGSIRDSVLSGREQSRKEAGYDEALKAYDDFLSIKNDNMTRLSEAEYSSWLATTSNERLRVHKALNAALKKSEKLYDEKIKRKLPEYVAIVEEIKKIQFESSAAGNEAIERLFNASPIGEAQAVEWVKAKCTIDSGAKKRLKKSGYSAEEVEKDMADFYRMTGGKLNSARIITKGINRAHTSMVIEDGLNAHITIGENFSRKTLFHEMGHNLEFDPKARMLAYSFIKKRRESGKLHRLKELTNKNYSSNEVAFKDSWFNPYVGKYYEHGTTEVFAMALGELSSPIGAENLLRKDKEMFDMVAGYLVTKYDDLSQFNFDIGKAKSPNAVEHMDSEAIDKNLLTSMKYDYSSPQDFAFRAKYSIFLFPSYNARKAKWLGIVEQKSEAGVPNLFGFYRFKGADRRSGLKVDWYGLSMGVVKADGAMTGSTPMDFETFEEALNYAKKRGYE